MNKFRRNTSSEGEEEILNSMKTLDIWEAVKLGKLKAVKFWLNKDPYVIFRTNPLSRLCKFTPLHVAAEYGHLEIVDYLYSFKIKIYAQISRKWEPYKWIFDKSSLPQIKQTLEIGIHICEEICEEDNQLILDKCVCTETALACPINKIPSTSIDFFTKTFYPNCTMSFWSPLHEAIRRKHFKIIIYFLKRNYDKNAQDSDLCTPLHVAVKMGYYDIAEYLISIGANIHLLNIWGYPPIFYAKYKDITRFVNLFSNYNREF